MSGQGVPITQRTAQRYLVGKTIESVDVEHISPDPSREGHVHSVRYLRLDDGSRIRLSVAELECDYAVTMTRYSPHRKRPVPGDPDVRIADGDE